MATPAPTGISPSLPALGFEAAVATFGGALGQGLVNTIVAASKEPPPARAIVTVPHARCSKKKVEPNCDTLSTTLAAALRNPGDELLIGTVPRNRADLNRSQSESLSFHRALNRLLKSDNFALLLDAHSFQPEDPKLSQFDVALLTPPDPESEALADDITERLEAAGMKVKNVGAAPGNWILQKAQRSNIPSLLIEVNESLSRSKVGKVGGAVTAARSSVFIPVEPFSSGEPPTVNPAAGRVAIRSIIYKCDGRTQIGLCPVHPLGKRFVHHFRRNAPLLDMRTGTVHGKVMLAPSGTGDLGIGDWPSRLSPIEVENRQRAGFRIGSLEAVVLSNGMPYGFGGAPTGVWVSADMQRMFLIVGNPAASGSVGGLPTLVNPKDFTSFTSASGIAAVLWIKSGCKHCQALLPHAHILSDLFPRFACVDLENSPDLDGEAERVGVEGLPALTIFADGEKVDGEKNVGRFIEESGAAVGV